jgi:hypothetical protein
MTLSFNVKQAVTNCFRWHKKKPFCQGNFKMPASASNFEVQLQMIFRFCNSPRLLVTKTPTIPTRLSTYSPWHPVQHSETTA